MNNNAWEEGECVTHIKMNWWEADTTEKCYKKVIRSNYDKVNTQIKNDANFLIGIGSWIQVTYKHTYIQI